MFQTLSLILYLILPIAHSNVSNSKMIIYCFGMRKQKTSLEKLAKLVVDAGEMAKSWS
jgi:hypothetical protein